MRHWCCRLARGSRKNRVDRRIHGRKIGRTACLEHAVEPDRIAKSRTSLGRHDAKTHSLKNLERQESAMLPSAEPERLGREKHVLADRRGLAEDVVAGLTLEDRQWQDLFGVEKSVFETALGACGAKAVAVVDDVHAAACGCIAAQRRIDKLPDQRDQRCADIADGQKQGAARPVRVPEVVSAHRRHAAGNVEPTWLKRPTLGTVDVEELAALLPGFDLAQLAGGDLVFDEIKPVVVGQEQRGVAAGPCRREGTATSARVRCGRRQIPERKSSESGARTDQQRFLELGQRDGRVRGLVAERALLHFEAETETPGAPAVERLEQRVAPGLVERCGRGHFSILAGPRSARNGMASKLALYWTVKMVQFYPLEQTTFSDDDDIAGMGRSLWLAARPDEPHAAFTADLHAGALRRVVWRAARRHARALVARHGVATRRGAGVCGFGL